MPYASTDALPDSVQGLPDGAKTIWMRAFNSAYRSYEGGADEKEKVAFKVAWAAVKREYEKVSDEWKKIDRRTIAPVQLVTFGEGDRLLVEVGDGLAGAGDVEEEDDATNGVALLRRQGSVVGVAFPADLGWTYPDAIVTAKRWAKEARLPFRRFGIERAEKVPVFPPVSVPFHRALLKRYVTDPVLAKKRIVYGEFLIPYEADSEGTMYAPDVIERAAHGFIQRSMIGIMHQEFGNVGNLVESAIAREGDREFDIPGTWWGAVECTEDSWRYVVNGALSGFSINGIGKPVGIAGRGVEGE